MNLFSSESNLLPSDGNVIYYPPVIDNKKAHSYLESLMKQITWNQDQAIIFGKLITTKREVAWYADEPFTYTYSKITKSALPWTPTLIELKKIVEEITNEKFNSCLLNLYHSGEEGMGWHADSEKELKKDGAIASLSLGATRPFKFKHKVTKEKVSVYLEPGSVLVMKDKTQTNWLHSLPKTKKVKTPRINLTFRTIDKARV